LHAALAGTEPDLPTPSQRGVQPPASLFLESVSVAGFRGVGGRASLRLAGRPGLTLIVGRNGSGKSSFAEAAELSLTGKSDRLSGQSISRAGWRNLHDSSPCRRRGRANPDHTNLARHRYRSGRRHLQRGGRRKPLPRPGRTWLA
jgi:DNA repair exonuclease SbcCD ATPase subunit